MQCGLTLLPSDKSPGLTIKPSPSFPVATGRLCQKGLNALDHVIHPERITEPLHRGYGEARRWHELTWNHALKDMVLRYHRMLGKNIWDRNGYDMHGLPTARAVMKKLNLVTKDDIEKYGVAKFVQACKEHSTELSKSFTNDLIRFGTWLDFEDPYLPVTNEFIEGVWWLVKKAEEKNRLYLGKKVMTWCYDCETACAKHEHSQYKWEE